MNLAKKIALAACVTVAGFSASANAACVNCVVASGSGVGNLTATFATLNATSTPEFTGKNAAAHLFFDFDAAGTKLTISTDDNKATYNLGTLTFTFQNVDNSVTSLSFNSGASFHTSFGTNPVGAFSATSFTLDLSALQTQNKNSKAVFDLTAAVTPAAAAAVPEPTTLALLGLGLLGCAAARRKSAK